MDKYIHHYYDDVTPIHTPFNIFGGSTSFVDGMDARSRIIYGENYAAEYTTESAGDPRVTGMFKLVRGIADNDLFNIVDKIVELYDDYDDIDALSDLFVITFQTRDVRGGKGEREIFRKLILILYGIYPNIVLSLLFMIPHYGYYKDYFRLLEDAYRLSVHKNNMYDKLIDKIYDIVHTQIQLDLKEYKMYEKGEGYHLSLLAKYIPKENKMFDKMYGFVDKICNMMYPNIENKMDRRREYRKVVTKLNKALDTTEVKMSANKFSEIIFSKVPSKALFKYRKAFFGKNLDDDARQTMSDDRLAARKNIMKAIEDAKIKGARLEIYDIAKVVFEYDIRRDKIPADERKLFQAQWNAIFSEQNDKLEKNSKYSLNNIIPIADVSGSMYGMPMYVAISLSILLSELNTVSGNRILTFSESPSWISFSDDMDIVAKIEKVIKAEWGMNTNFEAVCDLLIEVIEHQRLRHDQIPSLVVFSDMQFDEAAGDSWITHYEHIVDKFYDLGIRISGMPYDPPNIIFWNLRGDTKGLPVTSGVPNVKLLSGFSPSQFEAFMVGDLEEAAQLNPYNAIRTILDDDRYADIRSIVNIYSKNTSK